MMEILLLGWERDEKIFFKFIFNEADIESVKLKENENCLCPKALGSQIAGQVKEEITFSDGIPSWIFFIVYEDDLSDTLKLWGI